MSILGRLALLFVIVPLLELALLIQMGQWVGVRPTIGLVVLTGLGGAVLARAQGLRTLLRLRHDLANGRVPGQAIMDGMAVLAGGALLLTPGILTDLLGFSLLVPWTRYVIQKRIMARLERRIQEGAVQVVTGGALWSRPAHATPADAASPDPIPPDSLSPDSMSPSGSPGE